ncbi:MAG TPA: GNAT family N-acetyltransferase [Myxococcota bacterium]|nr:GNAT family N-acetyltransferase [Myxococcota bacterium]
MDQVKLPTTCNIKNGADVIVREMVLADEQAILEFFRALPLEDRHFLRNDVTDAVRVHNFMIDDTHDRVLAVVAELDGRIVASAEIDRNHYGSMTHIGQLRVIIAREIQHQGLGTILSRILMNAGIAAGIEKVLAETSTEHKVAMLGLEKMGFKLEATLKRHVKDLSGRKHDLAVYSYDVSHIWDKMEALVSDYSPIRGY